LSDNNPQASVHICRGVNRRFYAQVRLLGYRKWTTKLESEDYRMAVIAMATAFCDGNYRRGRVIMTADYYDPIVVAEMQK
jgi:hypothetical protein